MNDDIREAIRVEMAKRKWRQIDLAREAELSTQHVSQLMTGKTGDLPAAWGQIFKALGLKLVVVKDER